jgi:hypothetical protein
VTDQTKPALLLVNGEGQTESQRARMARETHERFLAKQATLAKKEKAAEERRAELRARSELVAGRGLPSIHLSTDPDSIRSIAKAVDTGSIPDTYVRAGAVVVVETPSGAIDSGDEPIQTIVVVDPTRLARMLADHTFTYEMRREKLPDGAEALVEVETTPKAHVSASALAATNWPNLRPLRGIVTAPVFRPDGTLVQSPGYDDTTGLIYSPKLSLAEVPERPSAEEVANARTFIPVGRAEQSQLRRDAGNSIAADVPRRRASTARRGRRHLARNREVAPSADHDQYLLRIHPPLGRRRRRASQGHHSHARRRGRRDRLPGQRREG